VIRRQQRLIWGALTEASSLQLLEDLRENVGDVDLWVTVGALARAVDVR
jgi:hypothetical protein